MADLNKARKNIFLLTFFVLFGILLARLFYIQVIDTEYARLADNQAIKEVAVYPERGLILDRNGKTLVNNQAMYDLLVIPAEIKAFDTAYFCDLLEIDSSYFEERVHRAVIRNGPSRSTIFMPMLNERMLGRIQENITLFPGFDLVKRPVRHYPFKTAANIFGYIHEVDSTMIRQSNNFYHAGDLAGISGLEKSYEEVLRGRRGTKFIMRDVMNREVGAFEDGKYDTAAIAGKDLELSLDVDLQLFGEKLMENKIGSIVAIDPQTGGILAMVNGPSYSPDMLNGAEFGNNYIELLHHPAKPLFNRAIQAAYPPGSTFKPIDAIVALEEQVITPDYGIACSGAYYGCGRVLGCTEKWSGHSGNLEDAITWSCNSYFFDIFRKIVGHGANPREGLATWDHYMHAFGLGKQLGVDLPGESRGNIPDSSFYNKVFGNNRWNSCNIVSAGIGQGEVLETPLQMVNAVSLIANKGYYYTPHLVEKIGGADHENLKPYKEKHTFETDPAYFDIVVEAMRRVVTEGTGRYSQIPGIEMCGKTGTAQNPHGRDHALFTAFAPKDHPRIAVAVVVENAGFGSVSAAPISSLMIEKYLNDTIADGQRAALQKRIESTAYLPKEVIEYEKAQDSSSLFVKR